MRRSCYALTWLFGALLVSLVTIGAARGQIPPPSPGSKGKGGDERDCPKPSAAVAFVLTESDLNVGIAVERGWSDGPLGWLPYDEEYRCGLPSENPEAWRPATITPSVGQQVLEESTLGTVDAGPDYGWGGRDGGDGVAAVDGDTTQDVGAQDADLIRRNHHLYNDFEPLGFLVLGYSAGMEAPVEADGWRDAVEGRPVTREGSARVVRESARALRGWGAWLVATADCVERWADDWQAGEELDVYVEAE